MNYLMVGTIIVIASILIILSATIIGIYNGLIECRENVNKAWANIDVILKQRFDEIPQLIKICSQYVEFEQSMISRVLDSREKMVQGNNVEVQAAASNQMSHYLNGLIALSESYPELKADTNFLQIHSRLTKLEETLADRREFYNDSINILNTRIQYFPDLIFARTIGLSRMNMFKVEEKEKAMTELNINYRKI